jgi:hypothetical protein
MMFRGTSLSTSPTDDPMTHDTPSLMPQTMRFPLLYYSLKQASNRVGSGRVEDGEEKPLCLPHHFVTPSCHHKWPRAHCNGQPAPYS